VLRVFATSFLRSLTKSAFTQIIKKQFGSQETNTKPTNQQSIRLKSTHRSSHGHQISLQKTKSPINSIKFSQ